MGKKVVHLIASLTKAGAETMLYQVLKHSNNPIQTNYVVSFGIDHYYKEPIENLGVAVYELPLKRKPITALLQLNKLLKNTDTLCCWMYHANLIGYILGKINHIPRIIWLIRHSDLDPSRNSKTTLYINKICAKFSKGVSAIAYNGNRARAVHEDIGYCKENGVVLENGCDSTEYHYIENAKQLLCDELNILSAKKMILSLTKNIPIKDIPTFIQSFSKVENTNKDVVAVLCGIGVEDTNLNLIKECTQQGLKIGEDIFLLGLRHDVPQLLSACDLYVCHSAGEAFPNALLQAMFCGCACVTTDVGDVGKIMPHSDFIVRPQDAEALKNGMSKVLNMSKDELKKIKQENREYVLAKYDIREIVKKYEELF